MAWKNLRLFSLSEGSLRMDSIMKQLEEFRFNGDEGITKFETWDDFDEIRLDYTFKIPKYIKIAKLEGNSISEEKLKMETFASVEVHIKSNGVIEAYGAPVLIERTIRALSVLGDIDPVIFGPSDFERLMKMSGDVRKVRIYGTDDEHVVEVALFGGGLSASKELNRLKARGKLREVSGKLELPDGNYGFTITEKSIRFFVKDPELAQKDIEFFIESLLSKAP
ncbi:MAG: hypothetical protein GOV01_00020 [Candidatus Altiarchaeota archaeon]|nr:hypothetical protein [Candidatus Altiarchaeota archaeon]